MENSEQQSTNHYEHCIVRRDELLPYANNARTHSEQQVQQVAASIREWGFTNPVLIDEKNNVIAGHCRLEAAQRLGMKEVPCIILAGLTEAQRKAYVIADNRLALNAGWDEELLRVELQGLNELDFDLDVIGFDEAEIANLLNDTGEGLTDDDAVPDVPEQPVTVEGDIWSKNHFAIGRGHYHVQHEPCWYAVRNGKTAHWSGDRKQSTIWNLFDDRIAQEEA